MTVDRMDGEDQYKTISRKNRIESRVKGSRFIATTFPCFSRQEAEGAVKNVKAEFSDATHNAFAFRVFNKGSLEEVSDDDGEPASSAGPPILQRLQGENLLNAAVVVTRYFGGTELGIGGLIRAYGEAAGRSIKTVEKVEVKKYLQFSCRGSYNHIGEVINQLEKREIEIKNRGHCQEGFVLKGEMPLEFEQVLRSELKNITGDKVKLEIIDSFFRRID
ncbi:IMPACT family protein [Halarsenatibacter silvermanii]|uniref:Uncharacterized protein, YigZ family n=1 Tax=Halarsenatibacter silvermanii TaxID=321763 RepID=A0A1G9JQP2_9FIRM|nr:YigZ family protein [Halarsenatibacter silvermanii]SDL39652.1 uncharacterized protein, YigZ family [Halarsenatibacter silvermanii]